VSSVKETFERLMESSDLDPRQRDFFELRYLDQLTWMESKAKKAQWFYYRLRLITIIGAVVVPALVSLNAVGGSTGKAAQIATWVVSLVVAISAAVEGFFQFGQRWRNYRSTAERLKIEGWLYFELAGPYASDNGSQAGSFKLFASRVEDVFAKELDTYITEVAAEKQQSGST
jgi:hypothetical protein